MPDGVSKPRGRRFVELLLARLTAQMLATDDIANRVSLVVEAVTVDLGFSQAVLAVPIPDRWAPITGWARLLAQDPKHPALVQALLAIERNALQQARIVEDLLDVSKIITGKLTFQHALLNPNSPVVAAVESMRDRATARGLKIDIGLPVGPVEIRADEMRLVQIKLFQICFQSRSSSPILVGKSRLQ
jgi:signal transduction histidine kinase